MTLLDLTKRHAALFPEEWYLAGGEEFTCNEAPLDDFGIRYAAHLDFYEKHLLSSPTEQTAKYTLHLAYHLAKQEAPSVSFLDTLNVFIENRSQETLSFPESIARVDLLNSIDALCKAYPELVPAFTHRDAYARASVTDTVPALDTDWQTWMQGLYGCTPLTNDQILAELGKLPTEQIPAIPLLQPLRKTIITVSEILSQVFGTTIENPEVVDLPPYLRSMIPSAAAYTFNRFAGQPRRVTYLNESSSWHLAKIILLIAHENFAHLWHFQEIDKHAPFAARLPAMYRYPVTEGVALLIEEAVDNFSKEIATACVAQGIAKDEDQTRAALVAIVRGMRRTRLGRALFEVCIYDELMSPQSALTFVSEKTGDPIDELKEDLFAFLPTPGYGATYCAGYFALKRAGATFDATWQKHIAETGFNLDSLCRTST